MSVPYSFVSVNNVSLYGHTTSCLSIHQLVDICVVCLFSALWIMLPWVFTCKFLYGHIFLILLSIYLGEERLPCVVTVFNSLRNCQIVLQSFFTILYSYQQCMKVQLSTSSSAFVLTFPFYCSFPRVYKVVSHCGLGFAVL